MGRGFFSLTAEQISKDLIDGYFQARGQRKRQEAQQRAAWQAAQHASHPLSRLGICGIQSGREQIAADKVADIIWDIVNDDGQPHMRYALNLDASDSVGDVDHVVVFGDHVLVVESKPGDLSARLPDHVAQTDRAAAAVADLTGDDAQVTSVLCAADDRQEPRQLPAPSGRGVHVVGLPWLTGIARQALLPGRRALDAMTSGEDDRDLRNGWIWPRLAQRGSAAGEAGVAIDEVNGMAMRLLDPSSWWLSRDLHLDDGDPRSIDLVVVGMTGAYVIEASVGDADAAMERAIQGTRRLGPYLPHVDRIPLVVDREADDAGEVVRGEAGATVGWVLRPRSAVHKLLTTPARGIDAATVRRLNAPIEGWRRTVSGTTTRFHWPSPGSDR